ncbi:MAG: hypothetical protein SF052_00855 [Bacteroidia bacterium]|nr:hypothetical protein [Bacteroidia bacterium]
MIPSLRESFNREFTPEKYQQFLHSVYSAYNHRPPFRIAETPVFIPNLLNKRIAEACKEINAVICQPDFKAKTQNAIRPPMPFVPGEDDHTQFLQMDFGICRDEQGELTPQLIEIQGFPSLYFFQDLLAKSYRENYGIPENYSSYHNGITPEAYIQLLKAEIVGDNDPRTVVLLEIEPEKQATAIDFWGTAAHLGIKVLCISKVIKKGKDLFYEDESGKTIPIKRIYNRVIFDELDQRNDIHRGFSFTDELNVEWVGHPNWFFRISKYTLPLLHSSYVPRSYYLSQLEDYPYDLENYVLKPLYSFAGAGVKLNVTRADLDGIKDRENFLLQRKVVYDPCIKTPGEPAKCEIRMLMLWKKGDTKARTVNNLMRLSKGEMIGVRFNKDKDFVGASIGFAEGGLASAD